MFFKTRDKKNRYPAISAVLVMFFLLMLNANVLAGDVDEIPISGQWFLSYLQGKDDGEEINKFYAHRAYLNFKPKFSSVISARITPDMTVDDKGNVKVRLKYLYMKFNLPSFSIFTKPYIEYGLSHRTWLDFEEHINFYRMQGTMFMERNHLFNSADFGITFVSLLGGEIDDNYQKNINKNYPGRYGSVSIGIYNGGGYHAIENNTNKIIESRITLRPVPDVVPGFQVSLFNVFGKGNIAEEPDWTLNTIFASFENPLLTATGTYYFGTGNSKGTALNEAGNSLEQSGYSAFGEFKIPDTKFSIVGRYDYFNHDSSNENDSTIRTIVGFAYKFHGHHKALLDYDRAIDKNDDSTINSLLKFTVEVHF